MRNKEKKKKMKMKNTNEKRKKQDSSKRATEAQSSRKMNEQRKAREEMPVKTTEIIAHQSFSFAFCFMRLAQVQSATEWVDFFTQSVDPWVDLERKKSVCCNFDFS